MFSRESLCGDCAPIVREERLQHHKEAMAELDPLSRQLADVSMAPEPLLSRVESLLADSALSRPQADSALQTVCREVAEAVLSAEFVSPEACDRLTLCLRRLLGQGGEWPEDIKIRYWLARANAGYLAEDTSSDHLAVDSDEVVHFETPAAKMRDVWESRRYYNGVSMPIGHTRMRYSTGMSRGRSVFVGREAGDVGWLTVTSKRVVFTGPSNTDALWFRKMLDIETYDDGIGIHVSNRVRTPLYSVVKGWGAPLAATIHVALLKSKGTWVPPAPLTPPLTSGGSESSRMPDSPPAEIEFRAALLDHIDVVEGALGRLKPIIAAAALASGDSRLELEPSQAAATDAVRIVLAFSQADGRVSREEFSILPYLGLPEVPALRAAEDEMAEALREHAGAAAEASPVFRLILSLGGSSDRAAAEAYIESAVALAAATCRLDGIEASELAAVDQFKALLSSSLEEASVPASGGPSDGQVRVNEVGRDSTLPAPNHEDAPPEVVAPANHLSTLLTSTAIDTWAQGFSVEAAASWDYVLRCAAVFWRALESEAKREVVTHDWDNLKMAVGNFKRDAKIAPTDSPTTSILGEVRRQREFTIPGSSTIVASDPLEVISVLDTLKGIDVATASTLASALWPDDFAILDKWVLAAGMGLSGLVGDWSWLRSHNLEPTDTEYAKRLRVEDYGHYLSFLRPLRESSGQPLVKIERALFLIGREASGAKSQTWSEYARALGDLLSERDH
jgi:hypothetical protein